MACFLIGVGRNCSEIGKSFGCCSKNTKQISQITLLVLSIIALAITTFVVLVSAGVFAKSYPLYCLGNIAPLGSGILLTLSGVSTVIIVGLLLRSCCKPEKPQKGFLPRRNSVEHGEGDSHRSDTSEVSANTVQSDTSSLRNSYVTHGGVAVGIPPTQPPTPPMVTITYSHAPSDVIET